MLSLEVEKSFSVLIFSGVLDRFPQLQIVSAENNVGWLPYYLQRMDRAFERQCMSAGFINKLKPSEYCQCQMWATYIDDFVGVANRHFVGVDKLMWSSDYPHQASTWPRRKSSRATSRTPVRKTSSRSPAATPPGSTASTFNSATSPRGRRTGRKGNAG
jgi:predicted TIM-barrel fold metal-dependent hydrolase